MKHLEKEGNLVIQEVNIAFPEEGNSFIPLCSFWILSYIFGPVPEFSTELSRACV